MQIGQKFNQLLTLYIPKGIHQSRSIKNYTALRLVHYGGDDAVYYGSDVVHCGNGKVVNYGRDVVQDVSVQEKTDDRPSFRAEQKPVPDETRGGHSGKQARP